MGPEPYSLAIILRENMGRMLFRNVSILATDIDEQGSFEKIINEGIYPLERIKRIPEDLRLRYFQKINGEEQYCITGELRNAVQFQQHNLLSFEPVRRGFGLIVCKNVLLHFKPEERVKTLRMFYDSLDTGGFLVIEQTQKLPEELEGLFEKAVSNAHIFRKVG